MALTINLWDAYAPKVTGVHNIVLQPYEGIIKDNKHQQWTWSEDEGYI